MTIKPIRFSDILDLNKLKKINNFQIQLIKRYKDIDSALDKRAKALSLYKYDYCIKLKIGYNLNKFTDANALHILYDEVFDNLYRINYILDKPNRIFNQSIFKTYNVLESVNQMLSKIVELNYNLKKYIKNMSYSSEIDALEAFIDIMSYKHLSNTDNCSNFCMYQYALDNMYKTITEGLNLVYLYCNTITLKYAGREINNDNLAEFVNDLYDVFVQNKFSDISKTSELLLSKKYSDQVCKDLYNITLGKKHRCRISYDNVIRVVKRIEYNAYLVGIDNEAAYYNFYNSISKEFNHVTERVKKGFSTI